MDQGAYGKPGGDQPPNSPSKNYTTSKRRRKKSRRKTDLSPETSDSSGGNSDNKFITNITPISTDSISSSPDSLDTSNGNPNPTTIDNLHFVKPQDIICACPRESVSPQCECAFYIDHCTLRRANERMNNSPDIYSDIVSMQDVQNIIQVTQPQYKKHSVRYMTKLDNNFTKVMLSPDRLHRATITYDDSKIDPASRLSFSSPELNEPIVYPDLAQNSPTKVCNTNNSNSPTSFMSKFSDDQFNLDLSPDYCNKPIGPLLYSTDEKEDQPNPVVFQRSPVRLRSKRSDTTHRRSPKSAPNPPERRSYLNAAHTKRRTNSNSATNRSPTKSSTQCKQLLSLKPQRSPVRPAMGSANAQQRLSGNIRRSLSPEYSQQSSSPEFGPQSSSISSNQSSSSENLSLRNVQQTLPSGNSQQSLPSRNGQQMLPSENSQQSLPSRNGQQMLPSENSQQSLPSRNGQQMLPSENSQQSLPSRNGQQMLPSENSQQSLPSRNGQQRLPSENSQQSLPSRNSQQMLPSENSQQSLPSRNGQQMLPSENSQQSLPSRNGQQMLPSENSQQSLSSKSSQQILPSEYNQQSLLLQSGQQILPLGYNQHILSSDSGRQNLLSSQSDQQSGVSANGPQSVASQNGQQNLASQNGPQNVASQNGPQSLTTQDSPQNVASQNGPQSLTTQNSPQNVASQNGPQSLTTQNGPQNEASQNSPQNVASQNGPQYVTSQNGMGSVASQNENSRLIYIEPIDINVLQRFSSSGRVPHPEGAYAKITPKPNTQNVASQNGPQNVASQNVTQSLASQNSPQNVASQNGPQNVASQNGPQNVASQNGPQYVTSQNGMGSVASQNENSRLIYLEPIDINVLQQFSSSGRVPHPEGAYAKTTPKPNTNGTTERCTVDPHTSLSDIDEDQGQTESQNNQQRLTQSDPNLPSRVPHIQGTDPKAITRPQSNSMTGPPAVVYYYNNKQHLAQSAPDLPRRASHPQGAYPKTTNKSQNNGITTPPATVDQLTPSSNTSSHQRQTEPRNNQQRLTQSELNITRGAPRTQGTDWQTTRRPFIVITTTLPATVDPRTHSSNANNQQFETKSENSKQQRLTQNDPKTRREPYTQTTSISHNGNATLSATVHSCADCINSNNHQHKIESRNMQQPLTQSGPTPTRREPHTQRSHPQTSIPTNGNTTPPAIVDPPTQSSNSNSQQQRLTQSVPTPTRRQPQTQSAHPQTTSRTHNGTTLPPTTANPRRSYNSPSSPPIYIDLGMTSNEAMFMLRNMLPNCIIASTSPDDTNAPVFVWVSSQEGYQSSASLMNQRRQEWIDYKRNRNQKKITNRLGKTFDAIERTLPREFQTKEIIKDGILMGTIDYTRMMENETTIPGPETSMCQKCNIARIACNCKMPDYLRNSEARMERRMERFYRVHGDGCLTCDLRHIMSGSSDESSENDDDDEGEEHIDVVGVEGELGENGEVERKGVGKKEKTKNNKVKFSGSDGGEDKNKSSDKSDNSDKGKNKNNNSKKNNDKGKGNKKRGKKR